MSTSRGRSAAVCILVAILLTSAGCKGLMGPTSPSGKTALFNGVDLENWKLYVADPEVDVNRVWWVKQGVVHCEGKPNGYMRTKTKYRDYKLHLEWRWTATPTNSGVLLHASGPDQVWPRCIEAQLKAGNAGDFVLINGTGITVAGEDKQNPDKQFVVVQKKHSSSEKAPGQWNAYDIVCKDGHIKVLVNGVLQNEGTDATDTSGWICLQSEGSPIEFRNIYLEPVE